MFTCIVVDQISDASSVDVATKERSEEALEVRYLPEQWRACWDEDSCIVCYSSSRAPVVSAVICSHVW